jgi:spermidine synthase
VSPALLFFSGISALVFQILWIKQLSLIVGVDVYAMTIAISGFFVGLAAGGAVFGRIADGTPRPLRLYAALEGATATIGILTTLTLARASSPFVRLEANIGALAWTLPMALFGVPALR